MGSNWRWGVEDRGLSEGYDYGLFGNEWIVKLVAELITPVFFDGLVWPCVCSLRHRSGFRLAAYTRMYATNWWYVSFPDSSLHGNFPYGKHVKPD